MQQNYAREVTELSTRLMAALESEAHLKEQVSVLSESHGHDCERITALEAVEQEYQRKVENGELIHKKAFEYQIQQYKLKYEHAAEAQRVAEAEVKRVGSEVEELTSRLFEEAGEMVSKARHEQSRLKDRNQQLLGIIKERDLLLGSLQQQLRELKESISSMDGNAPSSPSPLHTHPNSPLVHVTPSKRQFQALAHVPSLFVPPLRYDMPSFYDLIAIYQNGSIPSSPVPSQTPAEVKRTSLLRRNSSISNFIHSRTHSAQNSISSISPPSVSSATFPPYPASSSNTHTLNLKDTKFVKNCLVEDVEPTLRLDLAAGFSWLMKRSITNQIIEGKVIIEPIINNNITTTPCSMCSESRDTPQYQRSHILRLNNQNKRNSSSTDNNFYPLCSYCLYRLRSVCNFFAFLRSIRDGFFKCINIEQQQKAWDECCNIRLEMFWSRIGINSNYNDELKDEIIRRKNIYSRGNIKHHRSRNFSNDTVELLFGMGEEGEIEGFDEITHIISNESPKSSESSNSQESPESPEAPEYPIGSSISPVESSGSPEKSPEDRNESPISPNGNENDTDSSSTNTLRSNNPGPSKLQDITITNENLHLHEIDSNSSNDYNDNDNDRTLKNSTEDMNLSKIIQNHNNEQENETTNINNNNIYTLSKINENENSIHTINEIESIETDDDFKSIEGSINHEDKNEIEIQQKNNDLLNHLINVNPLQIQNDHENKSIEKKEMNTIKLRI